MRICVVGTGYVGLVAGAGFAEFGNDVTCADINESKIKMLNDGQIPIYEPGLESLVARNVKEERLHFSTDVSAGIARAEIIFIAVGTPPAADGSADLSHVWSVAKNIALSAEGFTTVVTKSTVPVGTADNIRAILTEHAPEKEFAVVSNPEFLKEGDAVNDFMKPAKVVIGTDSPKAMSLLRRLYEPFVRTNDRILTMDARSAEVTKYACNAMLATRISFMNEMARLCSNVGADVAKVRAGMAFDDRIGPRFLFPGVGYGGSCFPKDVKAIIATAQENNANLRILESVEEVNEQQKQLMGKVVLEKIAGAKDLTVAFWGLAFKPQTDDVREAPALTTARMLLDAGATIRLHDPEAIESFKEMLPPSEKVIYCKNNYQACDGADALLLMTEWTSYRSPDFARVKEVMRGRYVFDGRNVWEPQFMAELGFDYWCIGRPSFPVKKDA